MSPPPARAVTRTRLVYRSGVVVRRSTTSMPSTRALIGDAGATFANAFVNNPRCCPSRATLLTGQYSHNHGVLTNGPPGGGWWRLRGTDDWLPGWLKDAGYRTAHVGKFLNGYGRDDPLEVPPGWDEWYTLADGGTCKYYGYTLNENGALTTYHKTTTGHGNYQTDVFTQRAVDYIARRAADAAPFFLAVDYLAPHDEANLTATDPVPAPMEATWPLSTRSG